MPKSRPIKAFLLFFTIQKRGLTLFFDDFKRLNPIISALHITEMLNIAIVYQQIEVGHSSVHLQPSNFRQQTLLS